MPMTVITLSKVSNSLKGDLSKWMQEIATGVYIGNFNSKIRDKLWERIQDAVGSGEATISYPMRNELGYTFNTLNTRREIYNSDGIPLICFPLETEPEGDDEGIKEGFSNASKYYKARKFANNHSGEKKECYAFLDLETDGLKEQYNSIIEIGAVKVMQDSGILGYHSLLEYEGELPNEITGLTGITTDLLKREGRKVEIVLKEILDFLEGAIIVGYNIAFDLRFLNAILQKNGMEKLHNPSMDLMRIIKKKSHFRKTISWKLRYKAMGYKKSSCIEPWKMLD